VFPLLGKEYFPSQPGSDGVEVFAYGVESMGAGEINLELVAPSGEVADTVNINLMVTNSNS